MHFLMSKAVSVKPLPLQTIAHILATEKKQKVLLVDLDPQSNSTSLFALKDVNILTLLTKSFRRKRSKCLKSIRLHYRRFISKS